MLRSNDITVKNPLGFGSNLWENLPLLFQDTFDYTIGNELTVENPLYSTLTQSLIVLPSTSVGNTLAQTTRTCFFNLSGTGINLDITKDFAVVFNMSCPGETYLINGYFARMSFIRGSANDATVALIDLTIENLTAPAVTLQTTVDGVIQNHGIVSGFNKREVVLYYDSNAGTVKFFVNESLIVERNKIAGANDDWFHFTVRNGNQLTWKYHKVSFYGYQV